MNRTSIEWCRTWAPDGSFTEGFTVNPVRFLPAGLPEGGRAVTMCQKVSPGCAHCYAESISRRWWPKQAGAFPGYTAQGVAAGRFVLDRKALLSVLHYRGAPARVFWGDMTDLFQEGVPNHFLDLCFAVAALTPRLTHMFLTKRAARLPLYFTDEWPEFVRSAAVSLCKSEYERHKTLYWIEGLPINAVVDRTGLAEVGLKASFPLPNLWLGVSAENQQQADERIPLLLQTPAAVRFISAEPLLGPINLHPWLCAYGDLHKPEQRLSWVCEPRTDGLHWVICGGESGPQARPMHPDWARSLRDQCHEAGVSFFFKQWGEWAPWEPKHPVATVRHIDRYGRTGEQPCYVDTGLGHTAPSITEPIVRAGKKAAGALLDGREHREFPEAAGA